MINKIDQIVDNLIAEAKPKSTTVDAMGTIRNALDGADEKLLVAIAKDQGITKDVDWDRSSSASSDIYDLVFASLLKNGEDEEALNMFKGYVEANK